MTISADVAEHYRKNSSVQFGLAQKLLETVDFSQSGSILDVGCGDGKITEAISKQASDATMMGVDLSPAMVELARSTYPSLTFETADASILNLGKTFDSIVCLSCLHWVRKPAQAINRMAAHLNPGGSLLLLTFPQESVYYQVFEDALIDPCFEPFSETTAAKTLLTIDQLREALVGSGLTIETFNVEHQIACYEDAQEYMDYVKGWLPCWIDLPEDLHNSYLHHAAAIAEARWKEKGVIAIPYTVISIKAYRHG